MRKLFLTLVALCALYALQAQLLYGTTSIGGNGGGTISRLNAATGALAADFAFDTPDGGYAWHTTFVQATDGKLYGMNYVGGSYNNGTIFSYDPAAAIYKKLYDFNFNSGGQPFGSLIQATDGKLYGMTNNGGQYGRGVIFSFDIATNIYTKLYDFDDVNGAFPQNSLLQATDGKLYGMTLNGGIYDYGVVFSFNIASGVFTKLMDFNGTNGSYPAGDFIQAPDGKLYAMTFNGGTNNYGIIFSFNPATNIFTKLKDFDNINGSHPQGSFTRMINGKMYSTTWAGGSSDLGVIFSFNPATNVYTKLKDFDFASGYHANGNLTPNADGKLYGMTTEGGGNYRGVLFSYSINPATYSKLKDFNDSSGAYPYGSLTRATDGKMYAMTRAGGAGNQGVIFSYSTGIAVYTKLKDFGVNKTGSMMYGGLVKDASGKLYGMTQGGGNYALGVLFSFNPATATYTKLLDFDLDKGAAPYGSLILAADGNLYGMTFYGGLNGGGTIFSYNPATSTYTKLKNLSYPDGASPYGNLVQATNGKLYGITNAGGTNESGVLFSFDLITSVYTKLVDFNGANGAYPTGSLMQATNGKLYGVTYNGGTNDWGVLFSYNPATNVFTKLTGFDAPTGINPNGTLVQAANGKLYGMTTYGGGNYRGTIFSYNPATGAYAKVKDFDYANGATPKGSLTKGADGKLYGMTSEGGLYGAGVAFSFDPVTNIYTKLQDFNGNNGKTPEYTFFTEMPQAVKLKVNNVSVQEGNSGQKSLTFSVTLSASSSQTIAVGFKTKDGTAKAPTDYVAKTGTLTFAPGVKKQIVSILINGDSQLEGDERFKVVLSNPVNGVIADSIGVGTILNDDMSLTGTPVSRTDNSKPLITVYPNPAKNKTTLEYTTDKADNFTLQMTDVTGKVLFVKQGISIAGKNIISLDISRFAQGMYLVSITDEHGKQTIKLNKE